MNEFPKLLRYNQLVNGVIMFNGQLFRLTNDAVEHYGEDYAGEYEISGIFGNDEEHPGYDMGVYPTKLVESNDLPMALYEWEIELA